jgi:hypothetical protein
MKKHLAVTPENLLKSFYRASASPTGSASRPKRSTQGAMEGMELLAATTYPTSSELHAACLDFVSSNDLIVDEPMSERSQPAPRHARRALQGVAISPDHQTKEVASKIDEFLAEVLAEKR